MGERNGQGNTVKTNVLFSGVHYYYWRIFVHVQFTLIAHIAFIFVESSYLSHTTS